MALLHVASKHLGMNVLMFIRRLGKHSGLYGSKFDSFPPPWNNMKDLLLQKFLPLKEKGVAGGVLLVPFIIHKVGDLQYFL